MSEVNINYKGSTIASMDASGTKTLQTSGKYCEDDVEVVYTRPTPPVPSYQTKSVTPSESAQTVTADSGYDALEEVDVGAISSTYVGSGITRRSSTDLTASGDTVTVPAGFYESQASKAVSSGTAGTPTATKGTVSNHAVSVTPSVTNTTGYITGSTKTGTAVSVSASELVSGNKAITQNGTNIDVTNYATVSVNVAASANIGTKTATAPSSSNVRTLSFSGLSGEPQAFFVVGACGNSAGAVVALRYNGTNLACEHRGTGYASSANVYDNPTSDVTFTYSNGTLTLTTRQSSNIYFASNQTYELTYIY